MNSNHRSPDPTSAELQLFRENQRKIPPEALLPYAGRHVAWSIDGACIVASGDDMDEVEEKVVAAGVAPNRVVFGYMDDPEASYLG